MAYLTKRKFVLGPALEKKLRIEEKTAEAKQTAEFESNRLKQVSVLREEAEAKLREYQEELNNLAGTAEADLSQVFDLYGNSVEILQQAGQAVDQYLITLKRLNGLIDEKILEVRAAEKQRQAHFDIISAEDKRLEDKRNDIDIYEKRLRKKIEESGIDIKLIFNE